MSARVFISYRTSDGADKATALARDLDELFGSEQIFLDKEDLGAGLPWRDEVARTLQTRPILLVLVTPNYLGALDADGRRRIEQPNDPARTELSAALKADAHIVPLMCDGVTAIPAPESLPAPFDQLVERTWRRLRAYDWREDLARLVRDLEELGVEPLPPPASPVDAPAAARPAIERVDAAPAAARRRLLVGAGIAGGTIVAAALGWTAWQRSHSRNLSGRWRARIGARGAATARTADALVLDVTQQGTTIRFSSARVDIANDPDWRDYRAFWKERRGTELSHVVYRAVGQVLTQSGHPVGTGTIERGALLRVSATLRVLPEVGAAPIDTGTFRGSVDDDDRRIRGRLWLDSEQAERVVELRREE